MHAVVLACRRCGCRMLTKVGRAHPMLICTDCGQPVDQRDASTVARKRLWAAMTLMGLTSLGSGVLWLASVEEWRTATSPRQEEASSREEEGRGEKRASLLEPSTLLKTAAPRPPSLGPAEAKRQRDLPLRGLISEEAPAPAAQQQPQQQHPASHEP